MEDQSPSAHPFVVQATAVTSLMTVLASLVGTLAKSGQLDPKAFNTMLDQLANEAEEPNPKAKELSTAIYRMFKGIVKEETPNE